MKTRMLSTARLSYPLAFAFAAMLASQHVHADTIYYDGRASQTWNSNVSWSTSANSETPNLPSGTRPGAGDDVIFHISTVTATTAITMNLAGNQAANSMTFRNTGAFDIGPNASSGTGNKTLTIGAGGIIKNEGSAAVNIGRASSTDSVAAILLAGVNQTWTNNSTTGALTFGTTLNSAGAVSANLALNGRQLTLDGAGDFRFGVATSPGQVLLGNSASSLIKNGAGTLRIGGVNTALAAPITINGGTLLLLAPGNTGSSAVTISSGATGGVSVSASDAQHVNTGNFSLSNNSTLLIDSGSNSPNPVTAPLSVGTFTLGTGITLQLEGSLATDVAYPLVTWASGPPDTAAVNAAFNPVIVNGLVGTLNVSGTTLTVTFTTPPEVSWNTSDGLWDTGTANWLKAGSPSTFSNGQDAVLFGDAAGAGANPIVTLGIPASPASVTMNSTSRNYTIIGGGSIAGTIDLTLASGNTGTLTLVTANTYTGDTQVNGGTLRLGDGGTGGSLAATSPITLAGGTSFVVNQSDAVAQGTDFGVISGDGSFSQSGAGTTTLGLPNTFTGPISITSGNLQVVPGGRLNGGDYAGDIAIALGSTFDYSGTASQTLSGDISGEGSLVKGSSSILTLSGANTYSGATVVNSGTISLNNVNALQNTSAITLGGASAATLSSSLTGITISAPITTADAGVNTTIAFATSVDGAQGTLTLNGAIEGNGNVIFSSPNVGASTGQTQFINLGEKGEWAGSTTLTTGNSQVAPRLVNTSGAANVLPVGTVLSLTGGIGTGSGRSLTFDLNGQNQELAGLQNTLAVDREQRVTSVAPATLTINNSADYAFGGTIGSGTDDGTCIITGAISLTKTGPAKFTLVGSHQYSGNTTVNQGTLSLSADNLFNNNSTVTIASSAFLELNYTGTDQVAGLVIGTDPPLANGIYGATPGPGVTVLPQLMGTGTITVAPADPYVTWAGPGVLFDADANNDGVENGLAWLLGASGPNVNATGLLPVVTQTAGSLKLTFDMLPSAARGGAQFTVEHSSDLGITDPWSGVAVPDATGGAAPVTFVVTDSNPGDPINPLDVEVTISSTEAPTGKLFGRVKGQR